MSLVILTTSPTFNFQEILKKIARTLVRRVRGPQAVIQSAVRGFEATGQKYKLNPRSKDIASDDTIWVTNSTAALKWAIKFKKRNPRIKLVAGPSLVVTPDQLDGILFGPQVDVILQPSTWTRDMYETFRSQFTDSPSPRIEVWPAGVADPYEKNTKTNDGGQCLKQNLTIVYQKNAPDELFKYIIQTLVEKKVPHEIVKYGSYKHVDFLNLLDKANCMIFLSKSESQGIALQEAWIRDVPTLVWDRGVWEYSYHLKKHTGTENKKVRFQHAQISCPYLSPDTGMTFSGQTDFKEKLIKFSLKLTAEIDTFSPRNYSLRNLSDKITTQAYLDIIKSL